MCTRCQKHHGAEKPLNCPDCERKLQRSEITTEIPTVDPERATLIREGRSGGRPLSESLRSDFEPRFGRDLGEVRVHTSTRADKAARAVDAKAFTLGRDIVFRSGAYQPDRTEGRRLLAHELTHVVQQRSADTGIQRVGESNDEPAAPAQIPATGPRVDVKTDETSGRISIEVEGTVVAEAQPTAGKHFSLQVDSQWDASTNSLKVSVVAGTGVDVAMVPGGVEALGKRFSSVSVNVTDTPELIELEPVRERPFDLESGDVGSIAGEWPLPEPTPAPGPAPEEIGTQVPESTPTETEESSGGVLTTLADIATDFIPGVSNVKDAYTALTGVNPVTGEKVGVLGRIAAGIFAIPGLGNVAKYVGKGGKLVVKGIAKAGRAVGKKTRQAWDWLKKKVRRRKKPKQLKSGFNLKTPYATKEEMVEGVRQLEGGLKKGPTKQGYTDVLPQSHTLTEFQKNALRENIRSVIVNTIPAVKKNLAMGRDSTESIRRQISNPRFDFIDQVPEAKRALAEAFEGTGVNLSDRVFRNTYGTRPP